MKWHDSAARAKRGSPRYKELVAELKAEMPDLPEPELYALHMFNMTSNTYKMMYHTWHFYGPMPEDGQYKLNHAMVRAIRPATLTKYREYL